MDPKSDNSATMIDFNPARPRPVSYFLSQINDLFQNEAPNMTEEQRNTLSELQNSINSASLYAAKQVVDDGQEEIVNAKQKYEEMKKSFTEFAVKAYEATDVEQNKKSVSQQINENRVKQDYMLKKCISDLTKVKEEHKQLEADYINAESERDYKKRIQELANQTEIVKKQHELQMLKNEYNLDQKK